MKIIISFAVAILVAAQSYATEFILLETASLGPTGQSVGNDQVVLTDEFFYGAKFEVTVITRLEQAGIHMLNFPLAGTDGTMFIAIAPLNPATDLPNDETLSDAVVATIVQAPASSEEVVTDYELLTLEIDLLPGRYGVVVGSGLFGAGGAAALPNNDTEIGMPDDFTGSGLSDPFQWQDSDDIVENVRLFVIGSDVLFKNNFEG